MRSAIATMTFVMLLTGCKPPGPAQNAASPGQPRASEATTPAATSTQEMPGHVRLRVLPRLADKVDAIPRVVPNQFVSTQVADGLNARFARMDRDVQKMSRQCRAAEKDLHGEAGDFEHSVQVTMRGPRYLSLEVDDAYDCGGPHPDSNTQGLAYDITNGAPVNWAAALPGAKTSDASEGALVIWPELQRRALALADDECKDVYREPTLGFTVWLDGDAGALIAMAGGLSHYNQALCSPLVKLDTATLRKLGASAGLIDALDAAVHEQTPEAAKRRGEAAHRTD